MGEYDVQWQLAGDMAREVWCQGAADMMISRERSEKSWAYQKSHKSQDYLKGRHEAMQHLIALVDLGVVTDEQLNSYKPKAAND